METMTIDVMVDGRATITDPRGRKAYLSADQWAYIQSQRIEIRAANGERIEKFWYAKALEYHVLSQNTQRSSQKYSA